MEECPGVRGTEKDGSANFALIVKWAVDFPKFRELLKLLSGVKGRELMRQYMSICTQVDLEFCIGRIILRFDV